MEKNKSWVWKYFVKSSKKTATCKKCHKVLQRSHSGTSSMMNHLLSQHGIKKSNAVSKGAEAQDESASSFSLNEELTEFVGFLTVSHEAISCKLVIRDGCKVKVNNDETWDLLNDELMDSELNFIRGSGLTIELCEFLGSLETHVELGHKRTQNFRCKYRIMARILTLGLLHSLKNKISSIWQISQHGDCSCISGVDGAQTSRADSTHYRKEDEDEFMDEKSSDESNKIEQVYFTSCDDFSIKRENSPSSEDEPLLKSRLKSSSKANNEEEQFIEAVYPQFKRKSKRQLIDDNLGLKRQIEHLEVKANTFERTISKLLKRRVSQ